MRAGACGRWSRSSVRLAPMKDSVDLDGIPVRPSEEHPPVADPETKARSGLYWLDVTSTRSGVLIDGGNDAVTHRRVDPSQVAASPSGEHDACLSQRFYRCRFWTLMECVKTTEPSDFPAISSPRRRPAVT